MKWGQKLSEAGIRKSVVFEMLFKGGMGMRKKQTHFGVRESIFKDWESVFLHSQKIKVETLRTGRIICKLSGILNLKHKDALDLKEQDAVLPVLAHVISHEKHGSYLIDTGFDSSFFREKGGNFKGVFKKQYFKNRYIQEKEFEGIEFQLRERGINIKGVFLTHMHEHAAGAPSLPTDIPYLYGAGEKEINFFPVIYSDFLKNKPDLQVIDFSKGRNMPILGKCIDLFGDGSFWAVSTPGHTKGHISYIVNGIERQVLVAGDASISKKGFEMGVETGKFSSDIEEGRRSFLKLKEFSNQYPAVEVIFGHETEEFKIQYRSV